jgi:enoyl-CoA hydratase/carnithine racemase
MPLKPDLFFDRFAPNMPSDGDALARFGRGVCLDLRGQAPLEAALLERYRRGAERFSFPLIALIDADAKVDYALIDFADCVITDIAELNVLQAGISRAPIAAMTLIRLSRALESLSPESALDMESMAFAALQGGCEYQRYLDMRESPESPADENTSPVLLVRNEHELTITLNQPAQRNAISVRVRDALVEAFELVRCDDSITRVRLNGNGKCFSVGGALSEFGTCPDTSTAHLVRTLAMPGRHLARIADRCEAYVHGACIGAGVELPAFAARVVASPNSYFQLPEIGFGLIPGAGGCLSIPRRIGRHRFNWLALTGKRINARTALEWGLVDEVGDST